VVLDLACGTGVLGLACLRAGARFVHVIDETPVIEVARGTVQRAGFAARAAFHRARAQQTDLGERVDLVVCDHVGYFGFDYGLLGLLRDARQRFLKPEGTIIPAELRLSVAGVESLSCRALTGNWRGQDIPPDYHWMAEVAAQTKFPIEVKPDELLTEPVDIGTILPGADDGAFYSWTAPLTATRRGILDGISGWFACRLAADVWMTNSPLDPERIQRPQAFLPLLNPVAVNAGDAIRVTVMARPGDRLLCWIVDLPASGRRFAHSTWNGLLLSERDMVLANPGRIVTLSARGRARRIVLEYCDGTRSARGVEELVLREHPDLFPSAETLSAFVTGVLATDSEP
jgi:protein arginine N-methyltransferase 1